MHIAFLNLFNITNSTFFLSAKRFKPKKLIFYQNFKFAIMSDIYSFIFCLQNANNRFRR